MAKKYLIKSLLLALLTCAFVYGFGENYITKQEINVRSGPGTSYSILGIIPGDSAIDVQSITDNWATIQFNNQAAFIATKFISKSGDSNQTSGDSKRNAGSSTIKNILFAIMGIITILIIKFVVTRANEIFGLNGDYAFKYRCKNCGRYSTRRGHVYKCNNGAHEWFKL